MTSPGRNAAAKPPPLVDDQPAGGFGGSTSPRDRVPALSQRAVGPDEVLPDPPESASARRPSPEPPARGDAGDAGLASQPQPGAGEDGLEPEDAVTNRENTGTEPPDVNEPEGAKPEAQEREEHPPDRTSSPDRARARLMFIRLVELPEGDSERSEIRDQLVRMHLPLVEYLARRFRNRGEPLDDLVQVATIGLIKSVDRFDPERGVEFSTYATPTIVGEIKRHFRDKGWAIRVPRRLQELKLSLTKATSELSQSLGRSPTVAEIAAHLQMSEEEVLEGLESANAYSAVSLDAPDSGDDESPAVADTLGVQDESLEGVEYRESLKPLLEKLPPREKRILLLRFFGNMTQSQIATELGISQMHVSRLLARTLAQLRRGLLEDG
ncbi:MULTISPECIES: RNA polymerase sigma factor SigF [Pseudofrankia]|uniref:RNA polymerase sigma factor SigF n=1 Tax=Pseudofrankia TaxID=2994363 RepID=UPI000234CE9F|nr:MULTISPECIES: RNA polymerase sigma factor SigF [Pseudofrankia]